ncbi:pantoate--beta-alanine ligase [Ancylobacter lacus]|uniref:pantoate--beta-alanine ligase n=1 Tax=Ancylobacter lacus TaxID=2579970 RepID=UPI001BCD4643|nr:pantoate--beta-alanine ligase [Ancylobacter lacus]MBS7540874.1 pantoate--beta-alanine ligase [Ancylobacter lacus]
MYDGLKRIRTVSALRRQVGAWRAAGERVALVPTMGALHVGHIALVRAARRRADRVVASVFVNPAQFGPNEDFSRYPRTLPADMVKLAAARTDAVFTPDVAEMYPDGFCTTVSLGGPAEGLESAFRPTHFAGVATVVAKLFTQCRPDLAFFGEKDYQQLQVVSRMARDLDLGVKVVGVPTVREPDGLALSSRNIYLSPEERQLAPLIYRALTAAAERIAAGGDAGAAADEARNLLESQGFSVDYVAARHALTLAPVASVADGPIRLLTAARLGRTRLIDNVPVPAG